jgi:hypothetical protein
MKRLAALAKIGIGSIILWYACALIPPPPKGPGEAEARARTRLLGSDFFLGHSNVMLIHLGAGMIGVVFLVSGVIAFRPSKAPARTAKN